MTDLLSDAELEDLEKKRREATPGPWYVGEKEKWQLADGRFIRTSADKSGTCLVLSCGRDTDYLAAANPETIGKLIAEVKAARARPAVLHVKSTLSREAQQELVAELKQSTGHPIVIGPSMDGRDEGLTVAAEFFEAMDASGDREPLTHSAIAHLLREHAQDRARGDGASGVMLSDKERQEARVRVAHGKGWASGVRFADGTHLVQREDGTFVLPPEDEWSKFFERIFHSHLGTMGQKGDLVLLLKRSL